MRVVKGNQGQQPPQGQPDQNMQVKVALKDTEDVSCEKCGHKLFVQLMMFKKLSAIMSPTGEESLIPVQVFACNDCGHVNEQFLPPASE
jgi:DNA-directed RNA polymerase subunit RPC12/RpoP|tara:strand:- start:808 stop:1074 length:267 start_codon:yes stop_codon:yes gene_type:complete